MDREWPGDIEGSVPIAGANYLNAFESGGLIYLPGWTTEGWEWPPLGVYQEVGYDEASPCGYITEEACERLAALRPKVLAAKLSVLEILSEALRRRRESDLFSDCVSVLAEHIPAEDVDFLLEVDHAMTAYDIREDYSDDLYALPVGGITDILTLMGHCEKEIRLGTYAKMRSELRRLVRTESGYPRLLVSNYYELLQRGFAADLEAAYKTVRSNYAGEVTYWDTYIGRVSEAIRDEFAELVVTAQLVKSKRGRPREASDPIKSYRQTVSKAIDYAKGV